MRANARRPQTDCSPRKQREPIPESLLGPLEQRVVADGVRMDPDQNQLRLTFPGNAKDRATEPGFRSAQRLLPRVTVTLLCRKGILVLARNAELLHAEVERGPLHSKTRRCTIRAGNHPAGALKSLADMIPFGFFKGDRFGRFNFGRAF